MNFNRHSIRLKDYDYSKEGMYFITICIKNRMNILSNVSNSYLNNENCKSGRPRPPNIRINKNW